MRAHKLPSVCVLDVLDDGYKGAFGQLEQRAEDWCGDHQLGQARVRLCEQRQMPSAGAGNMLDDQSNDVVRQSEKLQRHDAVDSCG